MVVYPNNQYNILLSSSFGLEGAGASFCPSYRYITNLNQGYPGSGWSGSGCCVAIFYCQIQHRTFENRKTVCTGYPRKTRKGESRKTPAGKPGRKSMQGERRNPNINWSKWPVDVVNDAKAVIHQNNLYALRMTMT